MQTQQICEAAATAAIDAWKREQWESIPHILAGYSTALLQTAVVTHVLRFVDQPPVTAGDIYTASPTHTEEVTESKPAKPLKIVARPAISLSVELTPEKVFEICQAILTAADRCCYNLIMQRAMRVNSASVQSMLNMDLFRQRAVNSFALIGDSVPIDYAHQFAHNVVRNNSSPQHKILDSTSMIVATPGDSVLGFYNVSPVQVRAIGYPREKRQPIEVHYADSQFDPTDPMYNRLEFSLVTELVQVIHTPKAFIFISDIPTE